MWVQRNLWYGDFASHRTNMVKIEPSNFLLQYDDVILEMHSLTSKLFQTKFTNKKICIAILFVKNYEISLALQWYDWSLLEYYIHLYFSVISVKYLLYLFSFAARSSTF
jgi:hypothetical protein